MKQIRAFEDADPAMQKAARFKKIFFPPALLADVILKPMIKLGLLDRTDTHSPLYNAFIELNASNAAFRAIENTKFNQPGLELLQQIEATKFVNNIYHALKTLLFDPDLSEMLCQQLHTFLTRGEQIALLNIYKCLLKNNSKKPHTLIALISSTLDILDYKNETIEEQRIESRLKKSLLASVDAYLAITNINETTKTFSKFFSLETSPDADGRGSFVFTPRETLRNKTDWIAFTCELLSSFIPTQEMQKKPSLIGRITSVFRTDVLNGEALALKILHEKLADNAINTVFVPSTVSAPSTGYKLEIKPEKNKHPKKCLEEIMSYLRTDRKKDPPLVIATAEKNERAMNCMLETSNFIELIQAVLQSTVVEHKMKRQACSAFYKIKAHHAASVCLEKLPSPCSAHKYHAEINQTFNAIKPLLYDMHMLNLLFITAEQSLAWEHTLVYLLKWVLLEQGINSPYINASLDAYQKLGEQRRDMQKRLLTALNEAVKNYQETNEKMEDIIDHFSGFIEMMSTTTVKGIVLRPHISADEISTIHLEKYIDATIKLHLHLKSKLTLIGSISSSTFSLLGASSNQAPDILRTALKKENIELKIGSEGEVTLHFGDMQPESDFRESVTDVKVNLYSLFNPTTMHKP